MKPGEKSHGKPQNPKEAMRDLDQADGGGLKAKEADLVRGGALNKKK